MKLFVFISTITLILAGGLLKTFEKASGTNEANRVLRVGFPSAQTTISYEPTKIHLVYEYMFLENTFSPLVELDENGVIQPGVAESFEWKGDELHFKIRSDLKTISGTPISASDVVFSLKRLLILSSNTHGDFKALVCANHTITSVDESCPGIVRNGETVILKTGSKKPFLLPMLAAMDFAIIPRSSTDPVTLAITNYRETSGVYFVELVKPDGTISLCMNPSHYHAGPNIAEKVLLIPIDRSIQNSDLKALDEGRIDHVMTSNASESADLLNYAAEHKDSIRAHATMKIKSKLLVFTERGQRELSLSQRRAISEKVRASFNKLYLIRAGYSETSEFFPVQGDGGLDPTQKAIVKQDMSANDGNLPEHFKLALLKMGDLTEWSIPLTANLPGAEIYREKNLPDFQTYKDRSEMPHAFIGSADTGFLEDIGLISYSLSAGVFGMTKQQRESWLSKYMETPEKSARLTQLRDLHFHVLKDSILVPLIVSPFVGLVRKPWRMELSEIYSNNRLWLIKHD